MKYYKIVNPQGHYGVIYHEGINVDPLPFNPEGNCEPGGIYFSREDILAFTDHGTDLYEAEPIGKIYENPGIPKKWKAHEVNLTYVGVVWDNIPYLIEQGADIHVNNEEALKNACKYGHLDAVKFLCELGADIHADDEDALQLACEYGHLDAVKFLCELGADIHADDEDALQLACEYGRLDVVKYLVGLGADIHWGNNYSLELAKNNDQYDVVEYLESLCRNGKEV